MSSSHDKYRSEMRYRLISEGWIYERVQPSALPASVNRLHSARGDCWDGSVWADVADPPDTWGGIEVNLAIVKM